MDANDHLNLASCTYLACGSVGARTRKCAQVRANPVRGIAALQHIEVTVQKGTWRLQVNVVIGEMKGIPAKMG